MTSTKAKSGRGADTTTSAFTHSRCGLDPPCWWTWVSVVQPHLILIAMGAHVDTTRSEPRSEGALPVGERRDLDSAVGLVEPAQELLRTSLATPDSDLEVEMGCAGAAGVA